MQDFSWDDVDISGPLKLIINNYEYEYLTDTWTGPKGAAYNACYEFCLENGLRDRQGQLTYKGMQQVKLFDWYDAA